MSPQILAERINKLRIFADAAATFTQKINSCLTIPAEKPDVVALTFSLLTFAATILRCFCIIHAKHIKKKTPSINQRAV